MTYLLLLLITSTINCGYTFSPTCVRFWAGPCSIQSLGSPRIIITIRIFTSLAVAACLYILPKMQTFWLSFCLWNYEFLPSELQKYFFSFFFWQFWKSVFFQEHFEGRQKGQISNKKEGQVPNNRRVMYQGNTDISWTDVRIEIWEMRRKKGRKNTPKKN